jgi:hypothetical protein
VKQLEPLDRFRENSREAFMIGQTEQRLVDVLVVLLGLLATLHVLTFRCPKGLQPQKTNELRSSTVFANLD